MCIKPNRLNSNHWLFGRYLVANNRKKAIALNHMRYQSESKTNETSSHFCSSGTHFYKAINNCIYKSGMFLK